MGQLDRLRDMLLRGLGSGYFSAEAGFGVCGPVFAIESYEDRGVGDSQGGFEDEDLELFAGFVNGGDDFEVGLGLDGVGAEEVGDFVAVAGCAGGLVIGDEGEFGVHGDVGANVDGAVDGAEDVTDDFELIGTGVDGLNAGGGLEGIGGIDDEDPVAMAEEGELLIDFGLPGGGSGALGLGDGWEGEKDGESEEQATHGRASFG